MERKRWYAFIGPFYHKIGMEFLDNPYGDSGTIRHPLVGGSCAGPRGARKDASSMKFRTKQVAGSHLESRQVVAQHAAPLRAFLQWTRCALLMLCVALVACYPAQAAR